ncbi:MAG TPA: hypothetical protein VJ952_09475, partial [Opitutales bacterium]|nr:hypothetical protein [Opitutales bacterium]
MDTIRSFIINTAVICYIVCIGVGCKSLRNEGDQPEAKAAGSITPTHYYIHPSSGNDAKTGLTKKEAWRSFAPLNQLELSAGDRVHILAPGQFNRTLKITGEGKRAAPIEVH